MYIKKVRKRNRGSDKYYEYLHLVENVRTDRGPRQRLILNLGDLDIHPDKYKELANCIEDMLTGQKSLLSSDVEIEKHAAKAVRLIREKQLSRVRPEDLEEAEYLNIDVNSIEAAEPRSIGPEYVCHSMWKELQFDRVLSEAGISHELLPLIEALVIGRLVEPGSELSTWEWAENRSAIYELSGRPLRYSLSSLYRAGDLLFSCKDRLEVHLSKREKELFSLPEKICLFDLTNTYFEGKAERNPKAQRGRSKERRSDCKLQTLALIVDELGFSKYSRLYPGNQYEGGTLGEIIESLTEARPELAGDRTVIIDAGIAKEENIQYLKENNFHYIAVSRGMSDFTPDDTDDMKIIRRNDKHSLKIEVKRCQKDSEVYLLCRSTVRQHRDRSIRTQFEQLFLERLEYYKNGLIKKGHTKRYAKVVEMIGRLRGKYPRVSKMYEVEVIAEEAFSRKKNLNAIDIVWKKRKEYEEQEKLDGCYVLRTDRDDLSDKDIWETYVMITRVENAFRSIKSSLGLRPNFHRTGDRVDTHMFISVLAYHILHAIEHRLSINGDNRCWRTIKKILSTNQRLTIQYNEKTKTGVQRHYMRICSKAEVEHKIIYKTLGLDLVPLPKKRNITQKE